MTIPFPTGSQWLFGLMMMAATLASAHDGHSPGSDHAATHPTPSHVVVQEGPESIEEDSSTEDDGPVLEPGSPLYRTIKHAGKFHVLFIHFPIAFLLGASVAQWHVVIRSQGQTVVRVLLWAGTIGAVIAATLGWMYAYDSVYFGDDEKLLFLHRWLGTAVAATALLALMARPRLGPRGLAILLTLGATLVAAAGHYGASLVYGPDFLSQ
jgi:hypothetical protein